MDGYAPTTTDNMTSRTSSLVGQSYKGSLNENALFIETNFSISDIDDKLLGGIQRHGSTVEVVVEYISLCIIPLIVFVGVVGNAVCLCVFTSTYMRFKSSSTYLAILSLSDGMFLLCVFIKWLERVNVSFLQYTFVCKTVFYLMYLLCFISSWIVVAFTTERYILVYHPLIKDRYCTRKGAMIVCGIIVLTGALGYLVAFWTHGVNWINDVPFCMPLTKYYNVMTIVTGVDIALTFIIPVLLIVILNIRIIIKIHRMKSLGEYMSPWVTDGSLDRGTPRRRPCYRTSITRSGSMHVTFFSKTLDAFMDDGSYVQSTLGQEYGLECLRKGYVQRRTARFLLFASFVFILLNMPFYILRIKTFSREVFFDNLEPLKGEMEWSKVFQICYFLNFAVDFAVYSACSSTFRSALKKFVSRYRKKDVHACNADSA